MADVTDAHSEGVKLASRYQVATAPFFLVRTREEEERGDQWRPIRSYLQMKKIMQDAAAAVKERKAGMPVVEDPRIAQERHKAEEIRAQMKLLSDRLVETEAALLRLLGTSEASSTSSSSSA